MPSGAQRGIGEQEHFENRICADAAARKEAAWRKEVHGMKRLGKDDLAMAFLCGLGGALAYMVGSALLA